MRDLFKPPPVYRIERVEWWYVLLRDGCPIAQGPMYVVQMNPNYPAAANHP